MEERTGFLRYDGRRVAFATVGDGPVLVLPAWWVSHVAEDQLGQVPAAVIEHAQDVPDLRPVVRDGDGRRRRHRQERARREALAPDPPVVRNVAGVPHG